MRLIKFTFAFLFFISTSIQTNSQSSENSTSGISTERLERFDNFINQEISEGSISGASTLIVRNGVIAQNKSYGYNNIKTKSQMNTDAIFYLQSMTKPIMTVAFMMLYEEGHFMLTDPVSKYLPELKGLKVIKDASKGATGDIESSKQEMTIAQVLSHTSGLTHGISGSKFDLGFASTYYGKNWPDINSRVSSLSSLPLMAQPGTEWNYSVGPDLLSVLIEQFSGMNTQKFLIERIFNPLEMKDTGYNLTKEQQSRTVKLHMNDEDGKLILSPRQPSMEGNTVWSGTNALYSTTADYMKFCQMLLNKGKGNNTQLLSRKTIELMTSNQIGDLPGYTRGGERFGFGFAVLTDVTSSKLLGSNGLFYWGGAYNTHFFIDPKENLIAIFMTQSLPYKNKYHDKMRQLVFQAIID